MRIITKLTLGFLAVALLVLVVGFYSANRSQKILEKAFGENASFLAQDILDDVDKALYGRLEEMRACSRDIILAGTIRNSNQQFDELDDAQGYIDEREKEWPYETSRPFIDDLLGNMLSRELMEKVYFYEGEYGYKLYGEIFVTNKYGAVAALTSKTTDYYQADELWWQEAKKNGIYVGDMEWDESSGLYSNEICVRIDDEGGGFLGVLKAVLNNKETIEIIRSSEPGAEGASSLMPYETMHFDLLTKEGALIYSSIDYLKGRDDFIDLMNEFHCARAKDICTGYFIQKDLMGEGKEEIVAYAYSRGCRDYEGLGWILLAQGATDEIYAPVDSLMKALLTISLVTAILAIILGLIVSNSIYRPIEKLKDAMVKIGKGDFDTPIEIKTKDEIRDLADSIKRMVSSIKDKQEQLVEAKNTLEEWSGNLEQKVEERTKELRRTQDATFNIMEDLQEAYSTLQSTQNQLIQAEKMEAVGRMASGVAHEVKNPLSIILQGINYFERGTPQSEPEKIDILRMMKEELQRADSIISALMDFSRATKLDIKAEDINSVLEDSLTLVNHILTQKRIKVAKEFGEGLPKALMDKPKMEQVLVNVFLNAAHAMPEGGKLTVRSRKIRLEEVGFRIGRRKAGEDFFRLGETALIVEVEDDGAGIPKEKISKVFDPFFTTKEVGKGTGLGLSVSKNIIDMHKGVIKIESEEGKGTKVTITLKAAKKA